MSRPGRPRTMKPAINAPSPSVVKTGELRARTDAGPPASSGKQFAQAAVSSLKYSTQSPQRKVPQRVQISTAGLAG